MRQRRRAERAQAPQVRPRSQRPANRRQIEARQRQLLLGGAAFLLAIIIAMLSYGYYSSTFSPPRRTIATVFGAPIKLKDLVPYTALDSVNSGQVQPTTSLNNMVRDQIVYHYAGELGVVVPDSEVEQAIVNRFEPTPTPATATSDTPTPSPSVTPSPSATPTDTPTPTASPTPLPLPTTLSDAGKQAMQQFLSSVHVTEAQFRTWLRGQLYLAALSSHFTAELPAETSQVHVQWIVTTTTANAQTALDRINSGVPFATVAKDANTETSLSNGTGDIGWVPKGAFPQLDSVLFGQNLDLNVVKGPITTSFGYVDLRVIAGPEVRPISAPMQQILVGNDMQSWLSENLAVADVTVNTLTSSDITWVTNHLQ